MLNRTRFGRNVYAIGSSPEVARLSGISLRANLYFAYGIGGLMAGIAGVVLTARVRMAARTGLLTTEFRSVAIS
jgi:ribose transport system permease protein